MKNILFFTLLFNTLLFANINAVVSILPEKTFVKAIGGNKVNVSIMVLPGNSPHTYEPKPSQMKDIAKATLYFSIGVEFENVWLEKFKNLNTTMQIIDLTKGIEKMLMLENHHKNNKEHRTKDPHIWTAPNNVKIIAINILNAFIQIDPENENYYKMNYNTFITQIEKTDNQIKSLLLKKGKGTKFMVFHPSWGYFAHAYGLKQLPVEIEGKNPKPKELIALVKEAQKEKISAIFTQPEFSDSVAQVLANELKINVIKVSPLSEKWSENLIKVARAIAGK